MKYSPFLTYPQPDSIQSPKSIYQAAIDGGILDTDWGQAFVDECPDEEMRQKNVLGTLRMLRTRHFNVEHDGMVTVGLKREKGWYMWRYLLSISEGDLDEKLIQQARVLQLQHMGILPQAQPAHDDDGDSDSETERREDLQSQTPLARLRAFVSGPVLKTLVTIALPVILGGMYLNQLHQNKTMQATIQAYEDAFDLVPTKQYRIGVLRCIQKPGGFLHEDLITRTLDAPNFDVIQAEEFDTHPPSLTFCEKPTPEQIGAAMEALGSDLLVWGKVTEDFSGIPGSSPFTWDGFVFRNGLERPLTAQGVTVTKMADNVSKTIHHMLLKKSFVSVSSDLYSVMNNVKATAFFVQADIFSRRGKYQTSTDLFESVVEMEPEYFAARIKLGYNLYMNGRLQDAEVQLTSLLDQPDFTLPPVLQIEIFRTLGLIHYQNAAEGPFFDIMERGLTMTKERTQFKDDYLFFLQLEATFLASQGEGGEALQLVSKAFELTKTNTDAKSQVEHLFFAARLERWEGNTSKALELLNSAEAIATKNQLFSESAKVIPRKIEIMWEDAELSKQIPDLLEIGYERAQKTGHLPDETWIRFWEGRFKLKSGDKEKGLEYLESAYREAGQLGYKRLELLAGYRYVQGLLQVGKKVEARIVLEKMDRNSDQYSLRHQTWIKGLWVFIHFSEKDFESALKANSQCLENSRILRRKEYIASYLNDQGEILEQMERFPEAESAYLESLDLKNIPPKQDATGTMNNLIRLYTAWGKASEAEKYKALLQAD